jgi:carbon-monoxide dehydrogenase medium subunit
MHMATLGGNLCNASPAADSAPPLLTFDARVTLKSKTSERTMPLEHFFIAPGKTAMQPDELLTQIYIPAPPPDTGSAFIKIARVTADISQVCAAVRITRDGNTIHDARIALGSVAPTPVRATVAERDLIGQTFSPELAEHIGIQAAQEISPISDVRATREYRQHIAAVIVRDALIRAWERTQ